MASEVKQIQLLEKFYGEYYKPLNWEPGKKARNFFARIKKGKKNLFDRTFLKNLIIDDQIVFKQSDFLEGEIIEQKAVYIKGTKQETTFHGFFIIHQKQNTIVGEHISQKDALEYFEYKDKFPELNDDVKAKLRVKLGTVIRKLNQKYGEQLILEVLTDILEDYFPKPIAN